MHLYLCLDFPQERLSALLNALVENLDATLAIVCANGRHSSWWMLQRLRMAELKRGCLLCHNHLPYLHVQGLDQLGLLCFFGSELGHLLL